MADIITNPQAKLLLKPFEGMSDRLRRETSSPRAAVIASIAVDIPATGVGDNHMLQPTARFPAGFSYLLFDLSFVIEGTLAHPANPFSWSFDYPMRVSEQLGPASVDQQVTLTAIALLVGSGSIPAISYHMSKGLPKTLMSTTSQAGLVFTGSCRNIGANEQACRFEMVLVAYQYDIEQTYRYPINSPVLTRS